MWIIANYPVAVVGAYQPGGCRLDCVGLPACCGVLGMSLPLANTGVSGKEHDVCIPDAVPVVTLPPVPPPPPLQPPPPPLPLPPDEEHASAEGECLLVNGRRRDGPGRSVGKVLRSTGTWNKKISICQKMTGIFFFHFSFFFSLWHNEDRNCESRGKDEIYLNHLRNNIKCKRHRATIFMYFFVSLLQLRFYLFRALSAHLSIFLCVKLELFNTLNVWYFY